MPGPKNWAVWALFLPQLAAAAVGVAGLSYLMGAAVDYIIPFSAKAYSMLFVALSCVLVVSGQYRFVEKFARYLALILFIGVAFGAGKVFDSPDKFLAGLAPSLPKNPDYSFILPWIGTLLAGSMGIVWFSYWAGVKGYGGGVAGSQEGPTESQESRKRSRAKESRSEVEPFISEEKTRDLKSWFRTLDATAALGVLGGSAVITGFLILGAELLAPENLVPGGVEVIKDLGRLMGKIWGAFGVGLMVAMAMNAFGGSVVANQDGWGRSFADITLILTRKIKGERASESGLSALSNRGLEKISRALPFAFSFTDRKNLKDLYVVSVTGVIPMAIIAAFNDPVKVMSASGVIAAVHTPFIAGIILVCATKLLPRKLAPSKASILLLFLAGLFYLFFAVLYFIYLV